MKYINTKTGAIINSSCTISGGHWEELVEPTVIPSLDDNENGEAKIAPENPATENNDNDNVEDDLLNQTKPELLALAEELGLGNLNKLNKPEIIDQINEALNDIDDNQTEGLEG